MLVKALRFLCLRGRNSHSCGKSGKETYWICSRFLQKNFKINLENMETYYDIEIKFYGIAMRFWWGACDPSYSLWVQGACTTNGKLGKLVTLKTSNGMVTMYCQGQLMGNITSGSTASCMQENMLRLVCVTSSCSGGVT